MGDQPFPESVINLARIRNGSETPLLHR